MTIAPFMRSYMASMAVAALILISGTAHAQVPVSDGFTDLGAETFVQNCLRCHGGILTGNDLMNTSLSSVENLTSTVIRMQQFTAPLSAEQTAALVELLKDKEAQFRIEEAELGQMEAVPAGNNADLPGQPAAATIDPTAALFIKNCASCHSIGPGTTTGGDLTLTFSQDEAVVRANVSKMQVRTGPMTTDQIDQLTALLKDQKRDARLASAGYKPPALPATKPKPTQTTPKTTSAQTGAVSGEQAAIRPVSGEHTSKRKTGIPMNILGMTTGLGALVVVAGFLLAASEKTNKKR